MIAKSDGPCGRVQAKGNLQGDQASGGGISFIPLASEKGGVEEVRMDDRMGHGAAGLAVSHQLQRIHPWESVQKGKAILGGHPVQRKGWEKEVGADLFLERPVGGLRTVYSSPATWDKKLPTGKNHGDHRVRDSRFRSRRSGVRKKKRGG